MKTRKNKGFSLIELIVVIAIIGVMAAVAAPNFVRYRDNANLREAARDISSDIQLYKQKAMSENINYSIVFTGDKYKIYKGAAEVAEKTVGMNDAAIVISSPYPGGIITFSPRGTITNGKLKLKHSRSESTAEIETFTMGKVKVTI